ncbi:MAG: hypothetical protein VR78_10990 [Hoeflea sp. BRH_c9]|nr:MAG: hypothetical protein VR78_10990 [Hoeflea sp. BRH_c9]
MQRGGKAAMRLSILQCIAADQSKQEETQMQEMQTAAPETWGEVMLEWRPDGQELHRGFDAWTQNRAIALANAARRDQLFHDWSIPVFEAIAAELDGEDNVELFIAIAADRLPWAVRHDAMPDPLSRWMLTAFKVREWLNRPAAGTYQ